jgi:hypothetical protein
VPFCVTCTASVPRPRGRIAGTNVQPTPGHGVVTLTGEPELTAEEDLVPIAVRLAWNADGVVDVVNKTGPAAVGHAASR